MYAYLAVVLAFIGNSFYFEHKGYKRKEVEDLEALQQARESEQKALKEVLDAKSKRDIVYQDRIKEVVKYNDNSGCLDNPLPDELSDLLYASYYSK
jgi:hypothetical protein